MSKSQNATSDRLGLPATALMDALVAAAGCAEHDAGRAMSSHPSRLVADAPGLEPKPIRAEFEVVAAWFENEPEMSIGPSHSVLTNAATRGIEYLHNGVAVIRIELNFSDYGALGWIAICRS